MERPAPVRWFVRLGALAIAILALGACSSAGDVDSEKLQAADDNAGAVGEELSTGVPIGSILAATANLNLRTGPSTKDRVLHVIPNGAHVTTINRTTPSGGWYNIKHNGVSGWSYGAYLKLVSTPGGGGGGGSSLRSQAIARAKEGVGFSYFWGHGSWLAGGPSSSTRGTCRGSCPSCTHSGRYGADCSGYVAKIWRVPSSNSNVSVDEHPYSTYNFRFQTLGMWHRLSRSSVGLADAFVHHDGGAGHIFLHESGDGWGSMWTYEARGCADGIKHDLRTASSAYIAIAHNGY